MSTLTDSETDNFRVSAEGLSRDWGYGAGSDTTVFVFLTGGSCMGWILRLVETGPDITADGVDLIEIDRPTGLAEIANLGLTLPEAKQVLARMQQALVAAQAHDHAVQRPGCSSCNGICHIKDWRQRSDRDSVRWSDGAAPAMALYWLSPD
jgi:hypothetical protein